MALRIHFAGRWSEGETLVLPPAESRHVQVLRLQPGDTLALFNGEDELEWPAEIVRIGRNAVELRIAAPPATAPSGAPARRSAPWSRATSAAPARTRRRS